MYRKHFAYERCKYREMLHLVGLNVYASSDFKRLSSSILDHTA